MKHDPIYQAMDEVLGELDKATKKFGPMASPHEGYAVLKEEVDELWDEIKGDQDQIHMRTEAKHVAAMALRFMIDCASIPDGWHTPDIPVR